MTRNLVLKIIISITRIISLISIINIITIRNVRIISTLCLTAMCLIWQLTALAGERFKPHHSCHDDAKVCVSSGTKKVEGFDVHRDCWEWQYSKTCNYPSKDDCKKFSHCYAVANLPCLLQDDYGNCVNLQKEFSCKSWEPVTIDKEMVGTRLSEKEGAAQLICKGVPCSDGNCIDKSYDNDADMMDSVSQLYAVSQTKDAKGLNSQLFTGSAQHCSKNAFNYTNCCGLKDGWGKALGAKCSRDEKDLAQKRKKNLCVYVGKKKNRTMGAKTSTEHHYCCFGSMLNKVIQVQGRKQLGMNFGYGGHPDCRGLTLAEIMRLDFEKMDFSEFFADVAKRMKLPNPKDVTDRVKSSLDSIRKYDDNPDNKENNKAGWSDQVKPIE